MHLSRGRDGVGGKREGAAFHTLGGEGTRIDLKLKVCHSLTIQ